METKRLEQHQAPLYKESELETLVLVRDEEVAAMLEKQILLDNSAKQSATECYLVGDFANEDDAKKLSKVLSRYVWDVPVIASEVLRDFWVVYSSNGDWNQSVRNMETLRAKGVNDLWLVPSGSSKGVISLGLFATADGAEKRLKALSEKSIEAELIRRKKYRYGVKLITSDGLSPIPDNLDGFKVGENISIRKIAC
ncbi:MAG: hypothetical protein ACPHPA_01395 [Cycloclasticus pugetii]|uniref:hypothetical protein n=1 Tax=Cycloclasticus pugetii TaxID=34068 RepID=UPI002409D9F1|nr:hypothetical protein [Cycloclasticus pugetii]MDF1830546.1 hypothetical protein [Cycloclasticus pugetii]